jgi:hypothetical protein
MLDERDENRGERMKKEQECMKGSSSGFLQKK